MKLGIKTSPNTGLAKVAVQCSADTFVVKVNWFSASTFVVKIATFAKPENVKYLRLPKFIDNNLHMRWCE
jgi:hypothetical protein